jgi:hypothetical protein
MIADTSRSRRRRLPRAEGLESLTLTSAVSPSAHGTRLHPAGTTPLGGTANGTFFAHTGNPQSGTIYNLFASGKIAGVGPTLLVGGFQQKGFNAQGVGGGNLIFEPEADSGNVFLRLTERADQSDPAAGRYVFSTRINHGPRALQAAGAGTLTLTLRPINTNIHGQPVSNPGFFGNATLTFQSG